MADDSFGERTEKATGKRRTEARKKGNVARSREIPSVAVLLTGLSVLYILSTRVMRELSLLMVQSLGKMANFSWNVENLLSFQDEILWSLFLVLSPLLIAILGMSILSNYVQVGHLFSLELLEPKFSRVNPLPKLASLVSRQSLVELLKSIFKFLIIGWVAYSTIQREVPEIVALTDQEIGGILRYVGLISCRLFFKTLLVMVALAVLDYVFQRWTYEKELRMTKREVQEEFKQVEGDPLVKSRIRSIQRDLARKRMMAEVPKADVIITNPTHLAVALEYKREAMNAPQVVAKGQGWIAEKIKELARQYYVPIIENKPLAQALYKSVDLGETIPSAFYQVVADLLAHVYRLKNRSY